jgi:hypothetical protein
VLIDFLRANAEVFAWSPSDMPGTPRDVAEHSLDIRAGARPVKQPLRRFDEEKRRAIGEEIHKLMAAGFVKEVFHPEWLANPVLVKKKGGKWRMCVDYTSLNKACPKVPYPLPRIDQIVDSTAGCETLSFLDAYLGYHQIRMKESGQLATSFITPFGMYCYITMPFGLRNAGATYQRCMNHVFGEHIGRTVETYVDDIVVKTRKASDLLSDLETTFKCLKAKGVKLNPEKCVFRAPRGMLLGFIVSERGIEANPEKIAAITNMGPIKDLKGVQRVMGCLAALSRFISRLGERGLPLYRLLRKPERFTWTPEAEEALGNLKALLTSAPILVPPAAGEALLIYVAATTQVVSVAIVPRHPRLSPRVRHCASRNSGMGSRLIETGRPHTCNISTKESYPSTEPKLGDWRGAPSHSSCWVTRRSSTTAAPQASSSDAYPSPKVRSYCKK